MASFFFAKLFGYFEKHFFAPCMDKIAYILFIRLYPVIAGILSPFNKKAALWLKGRKNIFQKIKTALQNDDSKKIWMHCSSLGEFEQGRPLLEKLKEVYPDYKSVLTFFSPSGYEVKQNSNDAGYIFYLPIDSKKNAADFFDTVQPSLIIFIKYDYWYYYLKEAHERNIPLLLASGIFLPHFSFFKWYGKMRREMLTFFTHLFVQTENSKKLLQTINITNASVSGDTRFDRVLEVAAEEKKLNDILQFIGDKKTIVAGSTWTDDDEELDHFANTHPELRFIIAPHDIGESRIKECKSLYHFSITYSEYKNFIASKIPVTENIYTLIIDNIGMLKFLYRYATVCYVGGGFGNDGIHNILEAAVYYKPVLFGPEIDNFPEAVELIEKGGAFDVEDALELEKQLEELLTDEKLYKEACDVAGEFVKNNTGATSIITKYIQENLLLTS
jgi:3-deoxy-D-manno-octulosonic-acid transferase